jgi:hypothetical protein
MPFMPDTITQNVGRILVRTLLAVVLVAIIAYTYMKLAPAAPHTHAHAVVVYSRRHQRPRGENTCVTTLSQAECMQSDSHGWCVDRQGGGKCVPGFLDGPFDPTVHCANWLFRGMCQNGPLCRRIDAIPPPSMVRSWYHHPAPYDYRSIPLPHPPSTSQLTMMTPEADVARHVVD